MTEYNNAQKFFIFSTIPAINLYATTTLTMPAGNALIKATYSNKSRQFDDPGCGDTSNQQLEEEDLSFTGE